MKSEPEGMSDFRAEVRRVRPCVEQTMLRIREYQSIDAAEVKAAVVTLFEVVRAEICPEDEGVVTIDDTQGDCGRPAVSLGLPGTHVLVVSFDANPAPGEGQAYLRSGYHDRAWGQFTNIEEYAVTFEKLVRGNSLQQSIVEFLEHYAEHGYSAVSETDLDLSPGTEGEHLALGSGDCNQEAPDEEPG